MREPSPHLYFFNKRSLAKLAERAGFDSFEVHARRREPLELNGGIKYVDIDDEDDTSFYLGALYDVIPNLALGGDVEISDDATVIFLKGRYYFGPFGRR